MVGLEPLLKAWFGSDEMSNEPLGAVLGVLGSVYSLVFVFAFQSSRERIMQA